MLSRLLPCIAMVCRGFTTSMYGKASILSTELLHLFVMSLDRGQETSVRLAQTIDSLKQADIPDTDLSKIGTSKYGDFEVRSHPAVLWPGVLKACRAHIRTLHHAATATRKCSHQTGVAEDQRQENSQSTHLPAAICRAGVYTRDLDAKPLRSPRSRWSTVWRTTWRL